MKRLIPALICCLAVNLAGAATPLDLSQVPDRARWVVHLDVAGFLDTQLGAWLKTQAAAADPAAKLAALEAATRFNPLRDLTAITIGGASADDRSAVVQLRGTFDAEHLTVLLKAIDGYEATVHGKTVIHSWPEKDFRNYGCFAREDLVLIGRDLDALTYTLDTVNGNAGNLAGNAGLAKVVGDSYFSLAVATGLAELQGIHPRAAVLRHVQDLVLKLAEADGRLVGTASVTTTSAEAAEQVEQVAAGLRALALLNAGDLPPELSELVQQVVVARDGQTISVSLSVPVESIIAMAEKHPAAQRLGGTSTTD
jgi:hypothetical protein